MPLKHVCPESCLIWSGRTKVSLLFRVFVDLRPLRPPQQVVYGAVQVVGDPGDFFTRWRLPPFFQVINKALCYIALCKKHRNRYFSLLTHCFDILSNLGILHKNHQERLCNQTNYGNIRKNSLIYGYSRDILHSVNEAYRYITTSTIKVQDCEVKK